MNSYLVLLFRDSMPSKTRRSHSTTPKIGTENASRETVRQNYPATRKTPLTLVSGVQRIRRLARRSGGGIDRETHSVEHSPHPVEGGPVVEAIGAAAGIGEVDAVGVITVGDHDV